MAYTKTNWLDRAVQFATRYLKSGETSGGVTLTADPGTITQAGTPVNATNLNKLEQGVFDAHVRADACLKRDGTETMTGALTVPYLYVNPQDGVNEGGEIKLKGAGANPDVVLDNLSGKLRIAGYQAWDDSRFRVHSSGNYLEWFKGGSWQAMGGVISIPSDTVQQSFDTEYQKSYQDLNSDANKRFLVAKFTPKFTGDVKLKVDIKHTNVLGYAFGIVGVGSAFRPSTSPSIYTSGLSYQTPIGTLLSSAIPSGSGGLTNVINNGTVNLAGSYATYEVILQIAEVVPLFIYFSIGTGGSTNPSDYVYIKNVRLCYDLL